VVHVAVDLERIFAGKDGTAAKRALRGEGDGRDRATATDAPVAALEARTREEFFGYSAHLGETDRASPREAGVAQGLAASIH
jgi:hypothetical protein